MQQKNQPQSLPAMQVIVTSAPLGDALIRRNHGSAQANVCQNGIPFTTRCNHDQISNRDPRMTPLKDLHILTPSSPISIYHHNIINVLIECHPWHSLCSWLDQ